MSDTALRLADEMETDYYADVRVTEAAAELRRLVAENGALKAELIEQARLVGMGGEREARLMAENESLKLDLDGWADLHRRFMDNHVAVHALKDELVEALQMWMHLHENPAGFAGKWGKALDAAIAEQEVKVNAAATKARAALAKAGVGK